MLLVTLLTIFFVNALILRSSMSVPVPLASSSLLNITEPGGYGYLAELLLFMADTVLPRPETLKPFFYVAANVF